MNQQWAIPENKQTNKPGRGVGNRLRIYFSEKNPWIFRFATFLPLKIPESLHSLEILENCSSDTHFGWKFQLQKPRPMVIRLFEVRDAIFKCDTVGCQSYNFGPLVWGSTCNLIPHFCLFLITRPLVHHKSKSNSLQTRFWKDISHETLRSSSQRKI